MPSTPKAEDPDRNTGVLTRKQRRYLLGQTDIEQGTKRDRAMRSRIRQRVRDALLDFTILYKHLPADDREQIRVSRRDSGWGDFSQGIDDTIAFIYLVLGTESEFEKAVERGVANAEATTGDVETALQVAVTLDIARPAGMDMETVATRLERGEHHRVPPRAVMQFLWGLMQAGEFEPLEKYQDYAAWLEEMKERQRAMKERERERAEGGSDEKTDEDA